MDIVESIRNQIGKEVRRLFKDKKIVIFGAHP